MMKHLAIDMGSESGRAVVGYLENGLLKTEEIYRFRTQFMQIRDQSYRNLYRINEEIQIAMAMYAEKYGPHLDSISVTSWGGDFVVLNRDGNINHMPISYRAVNSIDRTQKLIEEKIGERALYERNGNQRMPQDPLRALLRMKFNDDPALDDPHGMLFIADAMHYMLGAKPCCERSMPTFGRLYDRTNDRWDETVFDLFELPKGLCSEIAGPGEVIGYVDESILHQVGLCSPVPIITSCTHDTACALVSVPDTGDDWAFISCGTWALMGLETDVPVINDISYANNFNNSSVPFGKNMFKRNMTGTWIIEQCKRAWKKYTYNDIVDIAERTPPCEYLIDINAKEFYSTTDMLSEICASVKRDFGADIDPDDVGTIAGIVFRSMVMRYRLFLSPLLEASGKNISAIYILGGGSKNRLLAQYTADACRYEVRTGLFEGSSTGNLLLQMYACGELKDKQEMRRVSANTYPQKRYLPGDPGKWDSYFETYISKIIKRNLW